MGMSRPYPHNRGDFRVCWRRKTRGTRATRFINGQASDYTNKLFPLPSTTILYFATAVNDRTIRDDLFFSWKVANARQAYEAEARAKSPEAHRHLSGSGLISQRCVALTE
jgi:hypothetical protein